MNRLRDTTVLEAFEYVERAKARALLDLLEYGEIDQEQSSVCSVKEIQQALPQGSALLEYYLSENLLLVFVVLPYSIDLAVQLDGQSVQLLVNTMKEFEHHMASFINGVPEATSRSRPIRTCQHILANLYSFLLKSTEKYWRGAGSQVKRLFIVPHGSLHGLPFSAMFDGQRYLIERISVVQVPSASVMLKLWNTRPVTPSERLTYFGIANPRGREVNFTGWKRGRTYGPIPGCEDGVKLTAAHFDSGFNLPDYENDYSSSTVLVLRRERATYACFLQYHGEYTIVDIQTHAEHDSGRPEHSYFLLTDKEGNPVFVRAKDILSKVSFRPDFQLLLMGVCQGSEVEVTPGGDLLGLAWAFMQRGARSILAYRWLLLDSPVATEFLELFSSSFLKEGRIAVPKDRAVQAAQLELIKRGRQGEFPVSKEPEWNCYKWPTWDHPYYWAWTLIGDHLSEGG